MNKIEEIIQNLLLIPKQIEYIDYYHREYYKLGFIDVIETRLDQGVNIYRSRLNIPNESFSSIDQISYPRTPPKVFGRTNCLNSTMFYGSYTPEEVFEAENILGAEDEIKLGYVTNAYEISSFLRDTSASGEERITIGKWQVHQGIKLAIIVFHEEYVKKTQLAQFLNKDFTAYLEKYSQYKNETMLWNSFISQEFAKPVEDSNHQEYIISATYTDFLLRKGFDGIIYPTVKLDGRGFNIALTPNAVDTCLKLKLVAEGKFYKEKKKTVMDWEKICEVKDPNLFEFKDDPTKIGEAICRQIINEQ